MKYIVLLFINVVFFSSTVFCDNSKDYSILGAASYAEITINRPAKEIWPYILNLNAWVANRRYENISGNPGSVGELTKASALDENGELIKGEFYFLKTIKIIPFKYYLFKATSAEDYSVEFSGFDSLTLIEQGNKTRVIFNANLVYHFSKMKEEDVGSTAKNMTKSAERRWTEHLQRLSTLVKEKG